MIYNCFIDSINDSNIEVSVSKFFKLSKTFCITGPLTKETFFLVSLFNGLAILTKIFDKNSIKITETNKKLNFLNNRGNRLKLISLFLYPFLVYFKR